MQNSENDIQQNYLPHENSVIPTDCGNKQNDDSEGRPLRSKKIFHKIATDLRGLPRCKTFIHCVFSLLLTLSCLGVLSIHDNSILLGQSIFLIYSIFFIASAFYSFSLSILEIKRTPIPCNVFLRYVFLAISIIYTVAGSKGDDALIASLHLQPLCLSIIVLLGMMDGYALAPRMRPQEHFYKYRFVASTLIFSLLSGFIAMLEVSIFYYKYFNNLI